MRKILLVAATMLTLSSITSFAQSRVVLGVKGGHCLGIQEKNYRNRTDIQAQSSSDNVPDFYIGSFLEIPLIKDKLWLQPEFVYSPRGTDVVHNASVVGGTDISVVNWVRLKYLDMPVMVKLKIVDNLTFDFGPQFGFLLSAKIKIKEEGETVKESFTDHCNKFEFALAGGLTYTFARRFDVTARYGVALTSVSKGSAESERNRFIQVGMGFRFW